MKNKDNTSEKYFIRQGKIVSFNYPDHFESGEDAFHHNKFQLKDYLKGLREFILYGRGRFNGSENPIDIVKEGELIGLIVNEGCNGCYIHGLSRNVLA